VSSEAGGELSVSKVRERKNVPNIIPLSGAI
jgi:hypothetical protein